MFLHVIVIIFLSTTMFSNKADDDSKEVKCIYLCTADFKKSDLNIRITVPRIQKEYVISDSKKLDIKVQVIFSSTRIGTCLFKAGARAGPPIRVPILCGNKRKNTYDIHEKDLHKIRKTTATSGHVRSTMHTTVPPCSNKKLGSSPGSVWLAGITAALQTSSPTMNNIQSICQSQNSGKYIQVQQNCSCRCHVHGRSSVKVTPAALNEYVSLLRRRLLLNKRNLTVFRTRKGCLRDLRTSSKVMGGSGVIVILCVVAVIAAADCHTLYVNKKLDHVKEKTKRVK